MEGKYSKASLWLTGLAVLFIPLSIIILFSGPWSINYQVQTHQWIRYLLFVSWILMTLAIIAGIANLISPMAEEEVVEGVKVKRSSVEAGEDNTVIEAEEESTVMVRPRSKMTMTMVTLMSQATLFALGIILYVVYISWLLLPAVSQKLLTGG
jgi:hypothetical protein